MFRWSDGRTALGALVLLALVTLSWPGSAAALPSWPADSPSLPHPAPPSTAGSTPPPAVPPGSPRRAPVLDIRAPVVPIYWGTSDVTGIAISEQTRARARFRLDSTVLFARDSAVLQAGARHRLVDASAAVQRLGPGRLRVVGYTDDLGSAQHGLALSRRRAAAVSAVLRRSLPRAYPISFSGLGEADPVAPNTSEANRKKNRRGVVTFTRLRDRQ